VNPSSQTMGMLQSLNIGSWVWVEIKA
jgi:hypothetical protein